MRRKTLVLFLGTLLSLLYMRGNAYAAVESYLITPQIQTSVPVPSGIGRVLFYKTFQVNYTTGNMVLSSNPDGSGEIQIGDAVQLIRSPSTRTFYYYRRPHCSTPSNPGVPDVTSYFREGVNNMLFRILDWCGGSKTIGPIYLVNTDLPDEGPEPFLDLPWDYEEKGLSFEEAALAINSFFDHEYPLLSSGMEEGEDNDDTVVMFKKSTRNENFSYSSHDGYDYGRDAKVFMGDPVLAAAEGTARYVNSCGACGNMILIDHHNGYQTRYLHLQENDLIINSPLEVIEVEQGQMIGRVGASGNVIPKGELGAHIHFGVFQDKNGDGNFEDNIPDGVTDPFGWDSEDPDPWEHFTFTYGGVERTGNKSNYLWEGKLSVYKTPLTNSGGSFSVGRNTIQFLPNSLVTPVTLTMKSEPVVRFGEKSSIGSTFSVTAKNIFGDLVSVFTKPFSIIIDFSGFDLLSYKSDSLSIYSSQDGQTWTKEDTFVDYNEETAKIEINHLTQFALMGELIDVTSPETSVHIHGEEGQKGWYRSSVEIELTANDSDGSGVSYVMYKVNDGEWLQYIEPFGIESEGKHKIFFYSSDNKGNIEDIKSSELTIDKTAPQVNLSVSKEEIWPPNGKMQDIEVEGGVTDENLYSKEFSVYDEYGEISYSVPEIPSVIQVIAKRDGRDFDGRSYEINLSAEDMAGNVSEIIRYITIKHDEKEK